MMLNLYLFRHGESEYNKNYGTVIGGRSNEVPLSERGVAQARALGLRLAREGLIFDEVYSSTAVRTRETARITLGEMDLANHVEEAEELLELSQGDWEGESRAKHYTSRVYEEMRERPYEFCAPRGESQRDVEQRSLGWIEQKLMGREEDLTVAIFGHGMTTKCILRGILNSDPSLTYRIGIDNCSITQLRYVDLEPHKGWAVVKINDHSHLRDVGVIPNLYG